MNCTELTEREKRLVAATKAAGSSGWSLWLSLIVNSLIVMYLVFPEQDRRLQYHAMLVWFVVYILEREYNNFMYRRIVRKMGLL